MGINVLNNSSFKELLSISNKWRYTIEDLMIILSIN